MYPIKLRLHPSWDETHTRLTLSCALPRTLMPWELTDLCASLRAWTGRRSRVVLRADAPSDWLDDWSRVLEDVDVGGRELEVEFAMPRACRSRR